MTKANAANAHPARIFLVGIACVGKSAIGARLAKTLGYAFYDLDVEIEKHFEKKIARLRKEEHDPRSFRKRFTSVVLKKLIESEAMSPFVMALNPSGLMDEMWRVLKGVDRIVLALWDSPENILARITFYDDESNQLTKTLDEMQRAYYLKEIKKDGSFFGCSYRKADIQVDIQGLDIERSAAKIEQSLREHSLARSEALSKLTLYEAVDFVRERLMNIPSLEKGNVWSTIGKQMKKGGGFDGQYVKTIQKIIDPLVDGLVDDAAIAMWRDTEVGMCDVSDDEELFVDCVRMDLEVALFVAVTDTAYDEAKVKTRKKRK